MKLTDIIAAGITGTTAFTAFSYFISDKQNKNYKEPELLGNMIDTTSTIDSSTAEATGWGIHYLTGIAFASTYALMIQGLGTKQTLKNGIIAGGISGLIAIAWWKATLNRHPAPPRKPSANYLSHLFAGHIIFGAASFITYNLLNKNNRNKKNVDFSKKLTSFATSGS